MNALFGSALNPNLHFHALVIDGAVTSEPPVTHAVFHAVPDLAARAGEPLARAL